MSRPRFPTPSSGLSTTPTCAAVSAKAPAGTRRISTTWVSSWTAISPSYTRRFETPRDELGLALQFFLLEAGLGLFGGFRGAQRGARGRRGSVGRQRAVRLDFRLVRGELTQLSVET